MLSILPQSNPQRLYFFNITLGSHVLPARIVQRIISFCKPTDILTVCALVSKNFNVLANDAHLWELVSKTFPPFKKRQVYDLDIYHRLSHAHQNINCHTDVVYSIINMPEPSLFLGKLGKYFLFQQKDGQITYYSILLQEGILKDIKKVSTISELSAEKMFPNASCSDDYLLVSYSTGILKAYDCVAGDVKHNFRFFPAEAIHHKIAIYDLYKKTLIVTDNSLLCMNGKGKTYRIVLMNNGDSLAIFTCSMKVTPINKEVETIKAMARIDEDTFVVGTARKEVFLWSWGQPYTHKRLCVVDDPIQRIDCDDDNNPNYIVICTEKSIICINTRTRKKVTIDLCGNNVLSISFQKNAFFVRDFLGNLYKCDVFSSIPILIYREKRDLLTVSSFPQVWVGLSLCFSNDPSTLNVINFTKDVKHAINNLTRI